MACDKSYLFVAGCPRSGTTVLTRLLNLHPDIVIGLERYKALYGSSKQIAPEMFQQEMFFNFQTSETNYVPARDLSAAQFYELARVKFPSAKFIGDKYPQFFRFYGKIFRKFPAAKIVFIVRDPVSVAQSWQRRANDSTSWPTKNDARRSITYWNESLAYTLAFALIKKDAFVFVQYEELFQTKLPALLNLFQHIGAELTPALVQELARGAQPYFDQSGKISARPIELSEEVVAAVREEAAEPLLEEVLRLIQAQSTTSASNADSPL